MGITVDSVIDALKYVDDPDLKKDLVTLGMIKDVVVDGKNVAFTVVLTTPASRILCTKGICASNGKSISAAKFFAPSFPKI